MRVYLPATTVVLRALLDSGAVGATPLTAFAVTPGLQEWYGAEDITDDRAARAEQDEELEYAALTEAARASLRMIDADDDAARRRVVLAVDVPDAGVEVRDDIDRGVVRLAEPVALAAVASVHVDDAEAEATIATAAESVIAADLGSTTAQDQVDDAEGFELSWYANQEIADVLDSL